MRSPGELFWQTIYLNALVFSAVVLLIILVVLSQPRFRNLPNYLLGTILVCVASLYVLTFIGQQSKTETSFWEASKSLVELFVLPVIYTYFKIQFGLLVQARYKLFKLWLLFIFALVVYVILIVGGGSDDWVLFHQASNLLIAGQLFYIAYRIRAIFQSRKNNKDSKKWVIVFGYALLFHGVVIFAEFVCFLLLPEIMPAMRLIDYIYYVVLAYFMIYNIVRYPDLLHGKYIKEVKEKYSNKRLSEHLTEDLSVALDEYMRNDKPFLNPDLSLEEVATSLGTTTQAISEVLNSHKGMKFYHYVNDYRIQEFLDIAKEPAKQKLKILALAYEAGFKSKSTFNDFFKRRYGLTPSQYLRDNN